MRLIYSLALLAVFITAAPYTRAQSGVDKTLDKVDKATEQANKAGNLFKKVSGMLGKKKSKTDSLGQAPVSNLTDSKATDNTVAAGNKTLINITGISFAQLKKLQERVQACADVKSSNMKFGAAASLIEVTHGNSSDALLKDILKSSKDIFTESNIEGFEEGKIDILIKKLKK